jgi:hypothetical protein
MIAERNSAGETTVVMTVQKGGWQLKDAFDQAEPKTLSELSEMYRQERQQLKKKLQPFRTILGERIDGYYSREQVQKIYLLIGMPEGDQIFPLAVLPHTPESWKAACKNVFNKIGSITRETLPAYYCERSLENESFVSGLDAIHPSEIEHRVIAKLEKELIIYRHFAFYQPELMDPAADILDRALTYYELLQQARERQTLEIDAHLRTLSIALLCYALTGSRKLYCDIDRLLFMHNEKQLQPLVHQLSIEIYCHHAQ